jgi:glycosyltransferase involved in cell wall biosynthesis
MIHELEPDYANRPASSARPSFHYRSTSNGNDHSKPAVAIVTATCRAAEFFRETAASIVGQSLQSWEWLLVDDASDDARSVDLLEKTAAQDPRIRIIRHDENRGPGAARNTGVAEARADLIYLIDDDDLIEPTTLEKCLWFLDSHPEFDFVNGWSLAFGGQEYMWRKGFDHNEAFLHDNVATGRCMIRKAAFEAVGGFDEKLLDGFEDWDLWLRFADAGRWGSTIPEFMDWYRRREDHSDRWSNWDEGKRKESFRKRLRETHPKLYDGGFPRVAVPEVVPFGELAEEMPCRNALAADKRRVLLILPWLAMGGSDKFNLDLIAGLKERGFEISIVTTLSGESNWESEFARHTPDIFHLHRFLPIAQHARFIRYLIESRKPEIVLASHSELAYLIAPYLRAHCPEPLYLDYCHIEQEEWKAGGYPHLAATTQDHFDLNIVSSRHLRSWMERRGADPAAISVLYTNIDPHLWKFRERARVRLREEWGIGSDVVVILFSGRICSQKQPEVLGRTLGELRRRNLRFKAVIAGDGEDSDSLKQLLRRERVVSDVLLLGEVSNDEIPDLMSAADVFFLPSEWEGIALSLFEAMAMKLPIVGAEVGGQRELVTPECGVLLPRGSQEQEVQAYAVALQSLIAQPEKRRQMADRARARIENCFQIDQMVDGFVDLAQQARDRREQSSYVPLSPKLAGRWAAQAVEYLRMSALADQLWLEVERARTGSHGSVVDKPYVHD